MKTFDHLLNPILYLRRLLVLIISLLGLCGIASNTSASADQETAHLSGTATASQPYVTARLICDYDSITAGQSFWLGLQMTIAPTWHIYWINPGDSGLAPELSWSLPSGFEVSETIWPLPHRFEVQGLVNYGYDREVTLLFKVRAPDSLPTQDQLSFQATAHWLVCQALCVPESQDVHLNLAVAEPGTAQKSPEAHLIEASLSSVPRSQKTEDHIDLHLDQGQLVISWPRSLTPTEVSEALFFPLEAEQITALAPQKLKLSQERYQLRVALHEHYQNKSSIPGILRLKSISSAGESYSAIELQTDLIPEILNSSTPASGSQTQLWSALLFAFLGGLILNLMPCVFPVLSIKVMGFVKQAGDNPRQIRIHGLVFTLGVLLSFWVLAGVLLVLRAGGEQLGWGFQLQSPLFLMILILILFVMGLNLFGVFEMGSSLMQMGGQASQKLSHSNGYWSSLGSGVLATVVATPCTAPFMGAALGFAISQPTAVSLLVFSSLALGLSSPYLFLAFNPSLIQRLPKPGSWMNHFKHSMGFLMMATVVWLLWVLGVQTDVHLMTRMLLSLLLTAVGFWIYGEWGQMLQARKTRRKAQILAIALLLLSSGFMYTSYSSRKTTQAIAWQNFDPQRIEKLRQQGQSVFVDFTAAWCLTCKVNEATTLSRQDVIEAVHKSGIVSMKADWTNRDPQITQALNAVGRNGVPCYVIYPAAQQGSLNQAIVLPEVLTPSALIEALQSLHNN